MKRRRLSEWFGFTFLAGLCFVIFQNCGQGFMALDSSSINNSSSSAQQNLVISELTSQLVVGVQLVFSVAGLPQGAQIGWANTLNQSQTCTTGAPAAANEYVIVCPSNGNLKIFAVVNQSGVSPLDLQAAYTVYPSGQAPTPTPAPTPAPTPNPQLASGQQLYLNNCASCHGSSASSSNKRGTSSSLVYAGISGNKGGMGSLSGLTASQIADIVYALNN